MPYRPPKNIWDVDRQLTFNEPLPENDPRYVHTEEGRGDFSFDRILKILGVKPRDLSFASPKEKNYIIFCGHRGCGKSTELRRLSSKLYKNALFFVVFIDATVDLDPNNLQYSDVLMALAKKLFEELEKASVEINGVFLSNLESWFSEKIESNEKTKDFAVDVKAGIKVEGGVPFLAKLFGWITNSFKTNSTYKEELRLIIRNTFSQFADAFNQLISAAEAAVKKSGKGGKILFVIDGTDRLSGEDSKSFFIDDSHQLQLIESNFIYCAPISLLYEGYQVQQMFDHFVLPMIKITDKDTGNPFDKGHDVLKEMIYKRADKGLFDSERTLDYIIQHSGGSPRELLKILHYAFLRAESDQFDEDSAKKAVLALATEYKRFLEEPEDYKMLFAIDHSETADLNPERVRKLLFNLALLEYNEYWRRSHPVIRLLDGYKKLSKS